MELENWSFIGAWRLELGASSTIGRCVPAIGITGGIATGKSTFTRCVKQLLPSARFFDADIAAREVLDLPEVREKLIDEFGEKIFSEPGHLNRGALRAIVFADAAKKRALERILHPPIRQQWQAIAETHRHSTDFFFADIPLLYETGGETLCDRTVVVACSRKAQLERILERGRTSHSPMATGEAEKIIKSQMPLEEKTKKADHVVWNNGNQAGLMEQARLLVGLWKSQ